MLMLSKTAVLKTVPRKYETGETCEICEILQHVLSITCVLSTAWETASENESYLRSQNYLLIIQPLDSNPKKNVLLLCRREDFP